MENFIVSARKYRPATFNSVVGQKHVSTTLKNAIKNNHLAQAFLFTGPRGVGKTTCARILAKTINCRNITSDFEACNECISCKSFNETTTFNIHELDAASNNSVDDIRSLVDQVRIPPQDGKYKVYIIDEVHMLSAAAFNAFLKTLEEPPAYAKFILATTEKHKIIPTILSRCQIYDFHRITIEDIASHLAYVARSENVTADPDALHIIAQKADGALRDALSIFDQLVSFAGNNLTYDVVIENLNVLDYDYYFKLTDLFLKGEISNSLLLFNRVLELGFDGQHFISGLSSHLRNLLICQDKATVKLLEVGDSIKSRYLEQAAKCSIPFLIAVLELSNKTDLAYKASNDKRLQIELCLIQAANMIARQQRPEQLTASDEKKNSLAEPEVKEQPVATVIKEEPSVKEAPKTTILPNGFKKPSEMGSISITKSLEEQKAKNEEIEVIELEYDVPEKLIEPQVLLEAVAKYAIKIEDDQPSLAKTLKNNDHEIDDRNNVTIILDHKLQNDQSEITNLLGFLKKDLNNKQIRVSAKVSDIVKEVKTYTNTDRLKKMVEKNPALSIFKEEFELDVEY